MSTKKRAGFDVTVIGGGIVGCSTALFLARAGATVTLLERLHDIGMEASGVNAGTLSIQVKNPKLVSLTKKSLACWANMSEVCGEDVGYRVTGGLNVAMGEDEIPKLKDKIDAQISNGLTVEYVNHGELHDFRSFLSDKVLAAGFCKEDGYCDPRDVLKALKRTLLSHGVTIQTDATVLSIETLPNQDVRVNLKERSMQSQYVVIAAGLWTPNIGIGLGSKFSAVFPVSVRPQQAMVTEAAAPFIPHVITDIEGTLSIKQFESGKIVIGGGQPGLTNLDYSFKGICCESVDRNLKRATRSINRLEHIHLIRIWCGIDSQTPDILPVLGPSPNSDRILFAKPGIAGLTYGPFLASIVADYILGTKREEIDLYSVDRFREESAGEE